MPLNKTKTVPINNENANTKVLIIDDDLTIRLTLSKILQKEGYLIAQAEEGQTGLKLFNSFEPDIVLLDVLMPILNGYETCKAIRDSKHGAQIPILMLTGLDDVAAIDHAFSVGATDFITKPINWPLLVRRVRYALRSYELTLKLHTANLRQTQAQSVAKLGFWEWDQKNNLLTWSEELLSLFNLSITYNRGTIEDYLALIPEDEQAGILDALLSIDQYQKHTVSLQHKISTKDKTYMVRTYATKDEHNIVLGVIQDITAIYEAEIKLEYQHYHDQLTNLPNRRMFTEQLELALKKRHAIVISIDIDRFHLINDTFGAEEGDRLLQITASRINGATQGQGIVARMASDEFCILLTSNLSNQAIESFVRRIQQALTLPLQLSEQEIHIETSAGIALAPQDAQDAEALINAAKRARLTSKAASSNQFAFYDSSQQTDNSMRFYLESELRNALKYNQFVLHYQPQIELANNKIIGVEALIRWQHPEMGLVLPAKFMPLVEEMELIHDIGDWIYEEAIRQAKNWLNNGLKIRVGINLSAKQFTKPSLAHSLKKALVYYQLPSEYLDLEITESMAMQNPASALATLNEFKDIGLTLAIDDFGTGYSSLEYLQKFPVDFVKVDRAFIKNLAHNQADQGIVKAIIAIANTLGLKVIAEGIEHQKEFELLQKMGCHEVQGYYISKPLSSNEATLFIKEHNAARS